MKSTIKFFYARGEELIGPHSLEEIQAKILDGKIKRDTKAWTKGMADWVEAENMDVLKGTFDEVPPLLSKKNLQKEIAVQDSSTTKSEEPSSRNDIAHSKAKNWRPVAAVQVIFSVFAFIIIIFISDRVDFGTHFGLERQVIEKLAFGLSILTFLIPIAAYFTVRHIYFLHNCHFQNPILTSIAIHVALLCIGFGIPAIVAESQSEGNECNCAALFKDPLNLYKDDWLSTEIALCIYQFGTGTPRVDYSVPRYRRKWDYRDQQTKQDRLQAAIDACSKQAN